MIKILKRFVPESIKFSFGLLDNTARLKLIFSGIALCLIGLLDLLAIGVLAIIASVTLSAINNQATSSNVLDILNYLGISEKSLEFKVIVLATFMVTLFISRTVFSIYFTNKIFQFLANQNNLLTKKTLINLLDQDLQNLRNLSSQEILFELPEL